MITIKNIQEAIDKLDLNEYSYPVMKDIVAQAFIIEKEFKEFPECNNQIIILDKDEEYQEPDLIPEIDENIEEYNKKLYILSDTGEGLLIYRKIIKGVL